MLTRKEVQIAKKGNPIILLNGDPTWGKGRTY